MQHTLLLHSPWLACVALGAMLRAQDPAPFPAAPTSAAPARDTVVFDHTGDGRLWALGTTYKASFGPEGFVYIPFFGSDAPRNYPVQFALRALRVGGRDVTFAPEATPERTGTRVTFDRGAVREVYELGADRVEQIFVIDGDQEGGVDVDLEVITELVEDAAQAGLQFGNARGHVGYGTAYLVDGARKHEIQTALHGRTLRLHVAAAQRDAGPVVIDPVITTTTLTPTLMASDNPDVAYDATTDRFCATWVHVFSQTDHDVVAELRTGNGTAVAGSFKPIDLTSEMLTWPRVANLNSADRFLITMERFRPDDPVGRQYTVCGRTMNAPAPFTTNLMFQISAPSTTNENNADVGGDSGSGTNWMVVWVSGTDIVGRLVSANGTPSPVTIPIDTQVNTTIHPQISLSNGNGLTATPRWCVVYQWFNGTNDWDCFAVVLDLAGNITAWRRVAINGNEMYPHVSCPLTDVGGTPRFMITWERYGVAEELVARVVAMDIATIGPEFNLTRRYGFDPTFSRVDCDGGRFAVACQIGTSLRIGTLAWVNNDLVLHEGLQTIDIGNQPYLASKRSGGGSNTEYGVVYIAPNTPPRAAFAVYEGRATAGGFSRRSTGCGLGIFASGRPFLGNSVQFSLTSLGTDLGGLLLGVPMPAVTWCANCQLGIDPTQVLFVLPQPMSLPLPSDPGVVGITLAVQGFALGSGPCQPAALRLSDAIDFTIQ
jgi:hypothetical protein